MASNVARWEALRLVEMTTYCGGTLTDGSVNKAAYTTPL